VIERLDELEASIQRWLEKNRQYIQFVVPIENALTTDPCRPCSAARWHKCSGHCRCLELRTADYVLRTEYPGRDLSIVDVLNADVPRGMRWSAG